MKNTLALLCLIFTGLAGNYAFGQTPAHPNPFGPHLWTATAKVIGEDGNPITSANVVVSYDIPATSASDHPTRGELRGLTDTNGIAQFSHTDSSWSLGIIVNKPGYYTSRTGHQFYYDQNRQNPTFTLTLKNIGQPIALYAKNEETKIRKENEPIGFDLMVGDWVPPYGSGKVADFFFNTHRKIVNDREFDADLKLTFANAGDGIEVVPPPTEIGSPLTMPRFAFENGYRPERTWTYHNSGTSPETVFGYCFRVRTVLDSNGNVKSALYGKIKGDVRFFVGTRAPQAGIKFMYYLNPTPNSRNLEFNPIHNLFGNLPVSQEVKDP